MGLRHPVLNLLRLNDYRADLLHIDSHSVNQVYQQHTATHCITLQHTATHCHTLPHTATHYNTPQKIHTLVATLLHRMNDTLLRISNRIASHIQSHCFAYPIALLRISKCAAPTECMTHCSMTHYFAFRLNE